MQLKVASGPRGDPKFKDCLLGTSPEVQLAMQGGPVSIPGQGASWMPCAVTERSHATAERVCMPQQDRRPQRLQRDLSLPYTRMRTRMFLGAAFSRKDTTRTLARFD